MSFNLTLEAKNLKKKFGKKLAVNGVSFSVSSGEIVGLLGPNGAGKTTSFYITVGLIKPTDGKIIMGGVDLSHAPMHKRANMGIGYLPQEASIFRQLSVRKNIEAVLEFKKLKKHEIQQKTDTLLKELEIEHIQLQKGYSLSGGERRRTEIARALATEPKFILLDEPFAGIDPIAVNDIKNIIRNLQKKDIGVLITDHNVKETLAITDRAYIVFEGKILVDGKPENIIKNKIAKKFYLGETFQV